MNAAQTEALLSRIEDRTYELRHLERLLESAEDFIGTSIVIPAGDNDNDEHKQAATMRDRAEAFVVACRLSLSVIRRDLAAIVEAGPAGTQEKKR